MGRPRLYFRLLSLLTFLCLAAYAAAGFRDTLAQIPEPTAVPAMAAPAPVLQGLVLRNEESCPALDRPDGSRLRAGTQLPNGRRLGRSAIYVSGTAESLAPCESASALRAVLREGVEAAEKQGGRLIYGYDWRFQALADDAWGLRPGSVVKLRFQDEVNPWRAEVIAVSESEDGVRAVTFRLTTGYDYWNWQTATAELVE
jgi:hypothetical protein